MEDKINENVKETQENIDIISKIKAGDEQAFNKFYLENIGLVHSIVNKFKNLSMRNPILLSKEDLEQEASIVFYHCVMNFNENKGCTFSSYFFLVCSTRFALLHKRYVKKEKPSVSLFEKFNKTESDSDDELIDFISDSKSLEAFENIDNELNIDETVEKMSKFLSPKEFYVFKSLIQGGETILDIGNDLKVSRQRVHQVLQSGREKIKKRADYLGI